MAERTKIVFFGNERLATGLGTDCPVLRALIDADYDITGVIVAQKHSGPSRKARDAEIVQVAEEHDIKVLAPTKLREAVDDIKALDAEVAVLVAYGKIVPQEIIDIFPHGIVNIHPSLLPRHRGPTPIEGVILQGEAKTGVSLMQLQLAMDAGPVYDQQEIELEGTETKQELAETLIGIGKDMLLEHLPAIAEGKMEPKPQSEEGATYDKLIQKADGELNFTDKTATELEREVRAYAKWPRSRCMVGTHEVIITKVSIMDAKGVPGTLWFEGKQLGMHCKEGVLIFERLIPTGKKEMDAAGFLAGYPM